MGDADTNLTGQGPGDLAGFSVSGAGDVDGDGYDDLLIGAAAEDTADTWAGAAYLVLGTARGTTSLRAAEAHLTGESKGDTAGFAVAASDVDGDGFSDLLVGAPGWGGGTYDGAAYVVLGPVAGRVDLGAADVRLLGEAGSDYAGWAVAAAGDADGDGYADVLVGACQQSAGGAQAGAAYLLLGGGY